jgi:hypothetical protein
MFAFFKWISIFPLLILVYVIFIFFRYIERNREMKKKFGEQIVTHYSPLIGLLKIVGESYKKYGDSYEFFRR